MFEAGGTRPSKAQGRARHASARKCRPACARRTTLLCPALRPGSTERRRVWPATGARLAMCPIWRFSTARHRSPSASSLSLQHVHPYMMNAASLNEGSLPPERAGGRRPRFALCYTHRGPYEPSSSCARRPAPSACQVESTCAARVISPTSSRASAARLNGAVRALAKARPLLCAAAACLACTHAHHYYDCLSLFLHLRLCVFAPSSPRDTTVSLSLPPAAACLDWLCLCPPANILRGW